MLKAGDITQQESQNMSASTMKMQSNMHFAEQVSDNLSASVSFLLAEYSLSLGVPLTRQPINNSPCLLPIVKLQCNFFLSFP